MVTAASYLYPALDAATESALRASIERFGVLNPVLFDQDGVLVDGHNRTRIAGELGIGCPSATVHLPVDPDEREAALVSLNNDRRQRMDPEKRREVVRTLREGGHSLRAIGGALGVAPNTVRADLASSGVQDCTPETTTGLDGKRYHATRPKIGRPEGTKSVPLALDTDRQRQIASVAKERIEKAVGTCNGIARGFDHLNIEAALLQATDVEIDGWNEALRDATAAIRRLQSRIKEARA